MSNDMPTLAHHSPLAPLMERYVQERQACGYRYDDARRILARLDRFLCEHGLDRCELPRALCRTWLLRQPNESAGTQRARVSLVRQFARYMLWILDPANRPIVDANAASTALLFQHLLMPADCSYAINEPRP